MSHSDLCYCGAYAFPHRSGSGNCAGAEGGEYICKTCGQRTEGAFTDFGIGAYEYCGRRGVDRNMQWVSTCCEATLLENTAAKQPASIPDPGYGDCGRYDD